MADRPGDERSDTIADVSSARTEAAPLAPRSPVSPSPSPSPSPGALHRSSGFHAFDAAVPGAKATSSEDGPALVANRYELLGMLGGGAMGTVYRARDRELDEVVALKVLRRELAATPGMIERFRREVKLARRVTHRNVARTFDIGEHGGDRFLTMEFIRGEMLGAYLARRGRLPVSEVTSIGRDVCAGLAAAHAADVLHRDLKPENVVLAEDKRAVITDFGIARAAAEAEMGRTVGGIVGTPAYMAPEQVEGASDLDARADLYALGVMLFELLTGEMAWTGDTVIAVAASRLLRPPPDPRTFLPTLPAPVAELVLRLMARRREDRFASADETDAALAELAGDDASNGRPSSRSMPSHAPVSLGPHPHASASATKTVAVLPLTNLGAPDDAYLADTVTEDLVDLLSVIPELRVRPRGQTARLDDPSRDVREIGRSLAVDVIVDGSLRRIGDVVRISIRLVTVADGFQLWARRFDRSPSKVLTVADEASSAIARALATERKQEARPAAADSVAQELYLRGRYLLHRSWFETAREAVDMLKEAWTRAPSDVRIGGTYAHAVARVVAGEPNAGERAREARSVIDRVLEMDRDQPEAHVALGILHLNAHEGTAAVSSLMRALSVSPNMTDALDAIGRILIEVGRAAQGIEKLERAVAIDPEMGQARFAVARAWALLGDMDAFEAALGPVPQNPGDRAAYMLTRGRVALWRGDQATARKLAEQLPSMQLSPYALKAVGGMLKLAITRQLTPHEFALLDEVLSPDPRFPPRRLAFHAQIRTEMKLVGGDVKGAIDDLRRADGSGLIDLEWLDRCLLLEPLRSHPEFASVRTNVAGRSLRIVDAFEAGAG